jgi:cobalt-zinc-cadmium resistance protein CzcA
VLSGLIEWSLSNRVLVIALFVLLAVGGVYSATRIPVDAVPDLVNIQVQVVTEAGTLSPLEVERYITYPVELAVSGLPDVEEVRSLSRFGISLVTVVFREGTDIFRARQLVAERLPEAKSRMSMGHGDPKLGTLSTALGEILQFELRGRGKSLMDLRSLLEWEIAPAMREVVARVRTKSIAQHRTAMMKSLPLPNGTRPAGSGALHEAIAAVSFALSPGTGPSSSDGCISESVTTAIGLAK